MKKLQKVFKAIAAIFKNPWLLNHVLSDDLFWEKHISKTKKTYRPLRVVGYEQFLDGIEDEAHTLFLDGGSMPTDLLLLKKLCQKFNACHYFEIGTWRGESAMNVSAACEKCVTLNLPMESMIKMGIPEEKVKQVGVLTKNLENVHQLYGNSLTFDFAGLNETFDVVFIDGDHHYDFVLNDTKKVFEHLIHDKSIVVWHDYAYSPEIIRPEVLAGIYDGTPSEIHDKIYHISNSLCAVYIPPSMKSRVFKNPAPIERIFSVNLSSKAI